MGNMRNGVNYSCPFHNVQDGEYCYVTIFVLIHTNILQINIKYLLNVIDIFDIHL